MPSSAEMQPSVVLADRLVQLSRLGERVDQAALAWLRPENLLDAASESARAMQTMDEAQRLIALTVDLAMAEGVAQSPSLMRMRDEWEARFSRLIEAVQQRQGALSADARLRMQQNHAAQAYLRHT